MADIYAFPTGAPATSHLSDAAGGDDLPVRPAEVPDEVWEAVISVRTMRRVPDVRYREIPVPSTLADFGIGIELECGSRDERSNPFSADLTDSPRVATGWIMILNSHEYRDDWSGRWRCVAFARMPLETCENDGLTPGMYWEDMCDHLADVEPDSVGGTVTVTQNTSFGTMGGESNAGCEMRVSWTPLDPPGREFDFNAGEQVGAWAEFLRSTVRFIGEDDVD